MTLSYDDYGVYGHFAERTRKHMISSQELAIVPRVHDKVVEIPQFDKFRFFL